MSTQLEKTYRVEGMTCGHCEQSVKEEVEKLAGVETSEADQTAATLVVRGPAIDDAAVHAAVAEAGYRVVG